MSTTRITRTGRYLAALPPAAPCPCEAEHPPKPGPPRSAVLWCECRCHANIESDLLQARKHMLNTADLPHLMPVS